ncbi:hypothetical protein DR62_06240 [Burkholderia thailandensis]|nr:hypothetical protein DR62_06240 [Burkholderia thailandensis]
MATTTPAASGGTSCNASSGMSVGISSGAAAETASGTAWRVEREEPAALGHPAPSVAARRERTRRAPAEAEATRPAGQAKRGAFMSPPPMWIRPWCGRV